MEALPMPSEHRCRLHYTQSLLPIDPASKPKQGEVGGIGSTFRLYIEFLIQRQLFVQKEVFRHECWSGA
jgi:hypothetical protein